MFEYETKNGQFAILLNQVTEVFKGNDKDNFQIALVGTPDYSEDIPLTEYTKFMNTLNAWAMKH